MKAHSPEVVQLYTDVQWALSEGLTADHLVPMLERLASRAAQEGDHPHEVFAKTQLAELIVGSRPFRAARLARDVLRHQPSDRAHAVLGIAYMQLGSFRRAEEEYRRALDIAPGCPWYAHNLGHLLDAGLDRTEESLPLLRLARNELPGEREVASSLAHALARLGKLDEARDHLLDAVAGDQTRADSLLREWTQPVQG